MLRKILAIVLIPLLLLCTSGGIVYIEHCPMSKSPSYSISGEQSCCCSKEFHDLCCTQSIVVIETIQHDVYTSESQNILTDHFFGITIPCYLAVFSGKFAPSLSLFSRDHAPPEPPQIFPILYRSLLI